MFIGSGAVTPRDCHANATSRGDSKMTSTRTELSAPSPGDDLRPKSAIRLRSQIVRSDSFWEIGCDVSVVTLRLRLRCILRLKMAKFASRCGNSLRFRLRFKKSLAIAVAMPWCT